MDVIAEAGGFIVAYPNGRSVGTPACSGRKATHDVDDVGFTRDVIDDMARVAVSTSSRVYATGMSNGGGMAHRFACEAADVIAAVAPLLAFSHSIPDVQASRPISIITFHGQATPSSNDRELRGRARDVGGLGRPQQLYGRAADQLQDGRRDLLDERLL